jgi:hypothetical protein
MRSILFILSALVLVAASPAFAGPKKKPAAPAKKPSTSSPVAAPTPAFESAAPSSGGGDGASPQMRGPARIDFDDRLIQGQTNKSGAVYLYDRKELKIRSMIKKRENFREEIVGSLYDT